jgi:hypothetical protein
VIVVTPPKCGTTWTQIIVTSLIAGKAAVSRSAAPDGTSNVCSADFAASVMVS